MKTLVALLLIITLLAVGGPALAQSGRPGTGQPMGVHAGTSSGGSYHLTNLDWQVSGTAAGGGYALTSPYAPALRGSGCCCTYLPCILRNR
jgi:predicted S18 family serine protease